ncbi:hypothetical protein [Nibrella saemangeumensis]|uniref:hypothetical protein n=1 Tax=Nibrella saemangeumensis TaxID=1084526 RepID=UPI0031EF4F1A
MLPVHGTSLVESCFPQQTNFFDGKTLSKTIWSNGEKRGAGAGFCRVNGINIVGRALFVTERWLQLADERLPMRSDMLVERGQRCFSVGADGDDVDVLIRRFMNPDKPHLS